MLLKKFHSIDNFMRGSVTVIHRKAGKKKYPGLYFSINLNRKTKLIYLGNKRKETAEYLAGNFKLIKMLIDQISEINMEILKLDNF